MGGACHYDHGQGGGGISALIPSTGEAEGGRLLEEGRATMPGQQWRVLDPRSLMMDVPE